MAAHREKHFNSKQTGNKTLTKNLSTFEPSLSPFLGSSGYPFHLNIAKAFNQNAMESNHPIFLCTDCFSIRKINFQTIFIHSVLSSRLAFLITICVFIFQPHILFLLLRFRWDKFIHLIRIKLSSVLENRSLLRNISIFLRPEHISL